MIRDQFQYSDRFDNSCLSCGQYGHDIQGCSLIHYNVNKSIFLYKISRPSFQPRGKIKIISSKENQRKKTNCLNLKILRWRYAQNTFDDYDDINVFEFSQINEKDREFFMRCPKIKNSYFKQESNDIDSKDKFGFQMINQLSANDLTTSSNTESINESDFQKDEYYVSESFQQNQFNKMLSIQSPSDQLNQSENSKNVYRVKTPNNNEKEINKSVHRQSFCQNAEDFSSYQKESQTPSLRNIKDKKLNINLTGLLSSSHSIDFDDAEKNQRLQNITESKGIKKKQMTQQEEKNDGGILLLRKQLDQVIEKLDCLSRKETEKVFNQQDNMTYISQNTQNFNRQATNEPKSTQYDQKNINQQIMQLQQNDKVKNLRFNVQRKEGRKQTQRIRFSKRENDGYLSDGNIKTSQPKEVYNELAETESSHIFGALKFNFDKMKEFSLYYPKYNYTNIIKCFKKIYIKNNQSKFRKLVQQNYNFSDIASQILSNTPRIKLI